MVLENEEKEVFTCTNCGVEVDANANVCPECGATFIDGSESEENFEQNQEIKCSYCGKKLSPMATICPKCGTPIDNVNKKIESTIKSLIMIGEIYRWLLIVCAVIYLILALVAESIGLIITTLILFAISFLAPIFFNWQAYVLKCLHDLTKKK